MQIPLQQYFTISPSLLLSQRGDNSINEKINLNIFLKDPGLFTPAFFAKVGSIKNNYIFSLSDDLIKNNNIVKDILPKLYLLSTLNLSSKKSGIIIPIFFAQALKTEIPDTGSITSYFYGQGIGNVKFPFFDYYSTANVIQNTGECAFFIYPSNPQDSRNQLPSDRTGHDKRSKLIIIGFEEEITTLTLYNEIIHRIIVAGESNLISFTFDDLSKYYIEKEVFEEEKDLWKNRALLYQNFLLLSKKVQQKEYYEVLEWYRNEYENLPLWYKRFGHIVKVLIGRRSFLSLFNDSVKKYKD